MMSEESRRHLTNNVVRYLSEEGPVTGQDTKVRLHEKYGTQVEILDLGSDIRNDVTPVYYVTGDERSAVQMFIEENYGFVEDCMGRRGSPLEELSDEMGSLFVEEWEKKGVKVGR
ncbi:MAG: hypothetical protein SXQ77_03930 [Halobacteria archaeon]|nr:hypothetical protein [Halobacteria archaeon]